MVYAANGVGKAATARGNGSGARNVAKRQLRACGDHQVVIVQRVAAVQRQAVCGGVNVGNRLGDKSNAFALQIRRHGYGDLIALAPAHRNPRVAGHELKVIGGVDHRHFMRFAQGLAHFIGGGYTAYTGSDNHNVCHG